jgi:BlaI family transcriptional regulator, penicillinase repressor
MHVLWKIPHATVRRVLVGLRGRPHLAYNTVLTTLNILEHKGYVTHARAGRAFVFRARVPIAVARRRAVRHLVWRLFENSPPLFVEKVVDHGWLTPNELHMFKRRVTALGRA